MSGRETVRRFREDGRLPRPAPSLLSFLRPVLVALGMAAIGAGAVSAFFAVAVHLPQLTFDAFAVSKGKADYARYQGDVEPDFGLTGDELNTCQNAARAQDYRTIRGLTAAGADTGPVIAQAATLACLARTKPKHLCKPDGAYQFLTLAVAEAESYEKAIYVLSHPEAVKKSGDPSVAGLPTAVVRDAYSDIRGTVSKANDKARLALRQVAKQGLLQLDIARASRLGRVSHQMIKLLDGVPLAPNACV